MASRAPVTTLTTPEQLREAMTVHEAIHGDPATVWKDFLFRHPVWGAEGTHRAIFAEDRIVALTTLAMWRQRIGDVTLPVGEIGLVGTLPEWRESGLSRRLMEDWIKTMRAERVPLSFLIGIPDFYERWDYHYAVADHVNAFLSITHDALARCAQPSGAVREVEPDRDLPSIAALIAAESRHIPCSPVIDEDLLRFFVDRADSHGVFWQVIEDDAGEISGVVRMKRWADGIGPQAEGAATLVAARDDRARAAIAAMLQSHLVQGKQPELALAVAPHGPFASWLYQRGAKRKSDRSIFPGGYAGMYRVNDLAAVLEAVRGYWDEARIAARYAGTSITLRVGRDDTQVATVSISRDRVEVQQGSGGVEVGAPPAVTVPWITGWRSAADWLDGTPFPPLPGPAFDSGDPTVLPSAARHLLRDLFPLRHPYIGDTIQGA